MPHEAPPSSPQPHTQVIRGHHGVVARVPLEVLEIIASNVDDEVSLSSCSLACRLWSAATRRHRFRVVEISFEWPRDGQRLTHISLLCDPTSAVLPLVRGKCFKDRDHDPTGSNTGLPFFNDILPSKYTGTQPHHAPVLNHRRLYLGRAFRRESTYPHATLPKDHLSFIARMVCSRRGFLCKTHPIAPSRKVPPKALPYEQLH